MRTTAGVRSDVGRTRRRNEDSYLVREPLFVVADGMGGHRGGDVASSMSVESLRSVELPADGGLPALVEAIKRANHEVRRRGESDRELTGMGTTMTAFLAEGEKGYIAHVGDSRAYLLRAGELQQLTEDHTLVQRMVNEGRLRPEDAGRHPARNVITRALGQDDEVDVDDLTLDLLPGDRLLLCSDGLTGMVDEARIRDVLAETPDPRAACDALIELANEAGGEDNITAIVIDVEEGDEPPADRVAASAGDRTLPVSGETRGPEPDPVAAGQNDGSAKHVRRRSGRRRAAIWASVAAVVLVLALVATRAYLDRQWYVGVSGGQVAVFNGIPATVLGVHLSHVDLATDIPAADAEVLEPWEGLPDGIPVDSRDAALARIAQIRQDLGFP